MNASDDGNGNYNHPTENEQRVKKGKGRQKITMAKIENDTNLQVTFSKRRAGVFKKASELSTLCGAESAVVVFSPGNKPHSFGHPDVETVANRFLHANGGGAPPRTNAEQLIMAHNDAAMHQRNNELIGIEAQLELERQRKKELDNRIQRPPPLDELSYEQLEQLKNSVLGFKHELEAKMNSAAAVGNPPWGPLTYEPFNDTNPVIFPVNHSGPSFATPYNPVAGNHEYTMVHYPPIGPSGGFVHGYSYCDPSAVVPYNAGTASSDAGPSGSSSRAAMDDGRNHQYQRFGGNYRRS